MNKHSQACKDYKEWFIDLNTFGFCEICTRSDKPLTVHHIYMASLYPKHSELHNPENLILVCTYIDGCHEKFHAQSIPETFNKLEEERDLKELFI